MQYCISCGKENRDEARFCGYCGRKIAPDATGALSMTKKRTSRPGMAVFFSMFLPGLGQLYNRRFLKGIILFALACVLLTSFKVPDPDSRSKGEAVANLGVAFLFFFLWIYAIIDAWYGAKEIK